MLYLLDTNICIAYINQSSPTMSNRLLAESPDDIFICDVVEYELYYGAYKSARVAQNLDILNTLFDEFVSLPFDSSAARTCGMIRADMQAKGTQIRAYDLADCGDRHLNDLTLVTTTLRNLKEYLV